MPRALYLCYFGLREPLVQTQVLPYLREIVRGGTEMTIVTFEPRLRKSWTGEERRRWSETLKADGMDWIALPYHKRPSLPATVYDIVFGGLFAAYLVRRLGIDVVHGRSHIGSLMGLVAKKLTGARLLFDVRGFFPEEYVDAGRWPAGGLTYRLVKRAEKVLIRAADGFVVLTSRGRAVLFPAPEKRPIEVIPCCMDDARFRVALGTRETIRRELGAGDRRVIVYVGSLGGGHLMNEMADFIAAAHRSAVPTFTVILTQSPAEMIAAPLRERGVDAAVLRIFTTAPDRVAVYLAAADVAISFVKPCYSRIAMSPTKIAEYLAAGLPIVSTAGIGDLDELLAGARVGVLIDELTPQGYERALASVDTLRADPDLATRCRETARREFDLQRVGGERYRRLYARLAS
jgi:glycosyltransferase involved in cell wall biosynthesis